MTKFLQQAIELLRRMPDGMQDSAALALIAQIEQVSERDE
jgi:hypothetical protein